MLTKEDYMRLPKERLAELLVELQAKEPEIQYVPFSPIPYHPETTHWGEVWCKQLHTEEITATNQK